MLKIPCGGFKLDESSFVLEDNTLSIKSVGGGGRYVVPMTIDWETNTVTPEIAVSVADLIARLDAGEDVVVKYNIGEKAVICGGYMESVGFASVVGVASTENGEAGEKGTILYFVVASESAMPFKQTHALMIGEIEGRFMAIVDQLP